MSKNFRNLTGQKFGRLTVIKRIENKGRYVMWECICDCGNTHKVDTIALTQGRSKSCGCLRHELLVAKSTKHGYSDTRLYRIWISMIYRCTSPKTSNYRLYGGKGIKVCDEWLNNFDTFYNWAMLNGYDDNLLIDRINSNKNYEPNNCRWVDRVTQNNNTSRNHLITYNGKTHTVAEWSRILGINYKSLLCRINRNWDFERAITQKGISGIN